MLKTTLDQESKITKRIILNSIARIYDPIGIAVAFIIKAKISMQRSWQLGYGCDEELPAEVCNEWMKIFHQFEKLNEISFHRSLTPRRVIGSAVLCIFSDASKEAFGTCAYLRWEVSEKSYDVRFVAAKSRVAPLKELSIPRLELQAAVLVVQVDTIGFTNTVRKGHLLYGQSNCIQLDSKSVSYVQTVCICKSW